MATLLLSLCRIIRELHSPYAGARPAYLDAKPLTKQLTKYKLYKDGAEDDDDGDVDVEEEVENRKEIIRCLE